MLDKYGFAGGFEGVVHASAPGEISEVVPTRFGLPLITLAAQMPVQTVPEEQTQLQIRAYLRKQKQRQALVSEISALRAGAKIEILADGSDG